MKKKLNFKLLFSAIIFIGVSFILFLMFYTGPTSSLSTTEKTYSDEFIQKGAYLARMGDCVACHTQDASKSFAGGLALESPIGAIYSSNITPDKETGIGLFTLADFDNAVRFGIAQNGDSLYPAMPYPSYAILQDEDIEALYAYFMEEVEPIHQKNHKTDIPWPLSMRWPLTAWRLLFSQKVTPFDADQYNGPDMARGAYLVQGLGHCGTCHTPRGIALNEKAYNDQDRDYLMGANMEIDGWIPTNLRSDRLTGLGRFSEDDLVELLTTGRNDTSAVFGGMSDVVQESLQYMTLQDAHSMAKYLLSLSPSNPKDPQYQYNNETQKALSYAQDNSLGAAVYVDNCMACHRSSGKGYEKVFPSLAGNPIVISDNPASLINIILQGSTVKGNLNTPTAFTMPEYDWRLNDLEAASVINFIRNNWGNSANEITENDVKKYRH